MAKKTRAQPLTLFLYLAGSIQNRYRQRREKKDRRVIGDYGRRWRKEFGELVESERAEFLKRGVKIEIVDPTRLDETVTHTRMDHLQPLLRRLQEKADVAELTRRFLPIWLAETKLLYRFGQNERVVVVTHLAETDVSGGTAIELGNIAHAGAPCYFFAPEDIIKRYRSRHVIVALHYNGRRILRRKNIFHSAEDVMVALKKDLSRILAMNELPVFGRLFFELWVKKLLAARKINKKTAHRLLKIRY
ncbi:MAG: hypothetical protein HYW90_04270 [Candidatus Sungbacteria bacterium]|nr:hypothetical protein [Candidatus Sungbacteria bacterium]